MRPAIALLLVACTHAVPSTAGLRAQTQQMFDAIAAGDRAVWDRYVDARALHITEAGVIETKPELLKEIEPLPPGITGHIAIADFRVEQFGDTAVVVSILDESETYFGHALSSQYTNVATWHHGRDGWRLVSSHVHASLQDPPAIALPADQLDEYAGTYRLNETITYAIRREGNHLVGQRSGRPPQPLDAEARDVFFVKGQPRSRKVFVRDASGRVTHFADRREGRDVVWQRE